MSIRFISVSRCVSLIKELETNGIKYVPQAKDKAHFKRGFRQKHKKQFIHYKDRRQRGLHLALVTIYTSVLGREKFSCLLDAGAL